MKNKCYQCNRRTPTCHAECEDYKEFVKRNEELKAKRRKEDENYNIWFDGVKDSLALGRRMKRH